MYALKPMGIPGKAPAHVKAWTQQEDDLLITLYPQHTARDIAGRLGRSYEGVRGRISRLREQGRIGIKQQRLSDEMIATLIRNRHTRSLKELAHMAKVSTRTVTNRLRALGYSLIKCGELHKNAVYSDCIVEIINQLRDEQGLTFREIAQRLSHELQPNPTPTLAQRLYWRCTASDAVLRELLPD